MRTLLTLHLLHGKAAATSNNENRKHVYVELLQWLAQRVDHIRLQVICVFVFGLSSFSIQAGNLET